MNPLLIRLTPQILQPFGKKTGTLWLYYLLAPNQCFANQIQQ